MAPDFKKDLQKFMDNLPQRGLSLDEIYKNAEERQARLVAKCFDACINAVYEAEIYTNAELRDRGFAKNDGKKINSTDFEMQNMPKTDSYYKLYRERMTAFLKESSPIYVIDGGVKSRARAEEKLSDVLFCKEDMIKDINRVTIVSDDYRTVDKLMRRINQQYAGKLCGKHAWDMKSFGMLSKSKYLNNDGFVAEIHFNEAKQMMLGEAITHKIYETMRINTQTQAGEKRFNESFVSLARDVKNNFFEYKHNMDEKMIAYTGGLVTRLNGLVATNIDKPVDEKQQALRDFNRRAHQEMMANSEIRWQATYIKAMEKYNIANPKKEILLYDEGSFVKAREYIERKNKEKEIAEKLNNTRSK